MALRGKASAGVLKKISQCGLTFEQSARKLIDLIGLHELGHVLTLAYGIRPPCRWSNEFLATYFAYGYLREMQPDLAALFVAMTYELQCLGADRPRHTSLEDFDRLYSGVGSKNYGWYQSAFAGRVREVYAARKWSFLEDVRAAYPSDSAGSEPA